MTAGSEPAWLERLLARWRAVSVPVQQAVAAGGSIELVLNLDSGPLTLEFKPKVKGGRAYKETQRFQVGYRGSRNLTRRELAAIDNAIAVVARLERDPSVTFEGSAVHGEDPEGDDDRLFARLFPFAQLDVSGPSDARHYEVLVRLTEACNQRCPFCSAPPSRTPSHQEVRACFDWVDEHLPGARLTLTGGEPTLRKTFLDELRHALGKRRVGDVLVQTNAVSFAKSARLDAVVRDRRLSFFVSLHAVEAPLYDRITATTGQLPLALEGIRRLLAARHAVTLNTVITRDNLAHLESLVGALPELMAPHPVPRLHLSVLMCPPDRPAAPDLLVRYSQLTPALARVASRAREVGVSMEPLVASTHASLPLCVVSQADRAAATRRPRILPGETGYERFDRSWVKADRCRQCIHTEHCLGVPTPYAQRFGLDELDPLR